MSKKRHGLFGDNRGGAPTCEAALNHRVIDIPELCDCWRYVMVQLRTMQSAQL